MLIIHHLYWSLSLMTCILMNKASAGFATKKFMKGLILGHALGMKKFIHFDHHHPHFGPPHMMPYPVPFPVPPFMSPIGSSIATSSVAVATPNALPMTMPMIAPAIGPMLPGGFAAGAGLAVNGFGLAGGAAINPFGLNLLPQGVINPFALNPLNDIVKSRTLVKKPVKKVKCNEKEVPDFDDDEEDEDKDVEDDKKDDEDEKDKKARKVTKSGKEKKKHEKKWSKTEVLFDDESAINPGIGITGTTGIGTTIVNPTGFALGGSPVAIPNGSGFPAANIFIG